MNKYQTIIFCISFFLFFLSGCNKSADSTDSVAKKNDLIATGECKPVENKCEILGAGIKLNLQFKAAPSYQRLLPVILTSTDKALESVSITMIIGGEEMPAVQMKALSDKKRWEEQLMTFAKITKDNIKIRLVVSFKSEIHSVEFPIQY
jgi:hypothetical protein